MENKNTIIALVLMLAVWLGFSFLFPAPPVEQAPTPPAAVGTPGAPSDTVAPPEAAVAAVDAGAAEVPAATQELPERELLVENDRFRLVLSSSGGRIKSLELKDYAETAAADSGPVVMIPKGPVRHASLRTSGSDGLAVPPEAAYAFPADLGEGLQLSGGETRSITLIHVTASGLQVDKTFSFKGDSYGIDLEVTTRNLGTAPLSGSTTLTLVSPWDDSYQVSTYEHVGPTTFDGEKLHKEDVEDVAKKPANYGQNVVWTAFETKYFISLVAPQEGAAAATTVSKSGAGVENLLQSAYQTLEPGQGNSSKYRLYFGPKDGDILAAVDPRFEQAIDFGFFSLLAVPLHAVLKFIYHYTGNYGIAIIIVTIIIKLLFWPLTQKSYTSMKAMQKLQPEMQKIRDRCKNDRERLNREIMEMYKTHRVNPMGGCLPMLVQIPVFFALYKVLMDTIDLRHAHFGLWLTDLSAKDPYYITPIVMGATMFIQQKMTPSTMDPVQAKVFMMMPIIFTFLFLNFPSGLVIYWLVNNLLTILQQYFINKKP